MDGRRLLQLLGEELADRDCWPDFNLQVGPLKYGLVVKDAQTPSLPDCAKCRERVAGAVLLWSFSSSLLFDDLERQKNIVN
jgi:hypothetical protein